MLVFWESQPCFSRILSLASCLRCNLRARLNRERSKNVTFIYQSLAGLGTLSTRSAANTVPNAQSFEAPDTTASSASNVAKGSDATQGPPPGGPPSGGPPPGGGGAGESGDSAQSDESTTLYESLFEALSVEHDTDESSLLTATNSAEKYLALLSEIS